MRVDSKLLKDACVIRAHHRVVVVPEAGSAPGMPHYATRQEQCDALVRQVRRHIDGARRVYVESDAVCRFCRSEWETDDDGQPVCCNAAVDQYDKLVEEAHDATKAD